MSVALPLAPAAGRRGLPHVPPAGPFWRVWHRTGHTRDATTPRRYGPLHRFDPHPAGPPAVHRNVFVVYGSVAFEVSALEVFDRGAPDQVVDICPSWRGTLITAPAASQLFDLTDPDAAALAGASVRLGDTNLDGADYTVTQGWARFLHASPGIHGLRYLSCRASDRGGIALALWRKTAIGAPQIQHLLRDDALWPYLVYALDSVGVAANPVGSCPRC